MGCGEENPQTSLGAISKMVRKYLTYYREDYIKDYINNHKVSEDTKELVEKETDLLIGSMMKEVWDLNKDRVIEELEKNNKKVLQQEKDKLNKNHEENEKIDGFKNIMVLLADGIVVAFFIGIGVNQATEIISKVKEAIFKSTGIPVWFTTLSIIVLIIFVIIIIIFKRFMDKFGDVIKLLLNRKTDK